MNCARRFGDDQFPTAKYHPPVLPVRVNPRTEFSVEPLIVKGVLANQDLTAGQKCTLIFLAVETDWGQDVALIPSKDLAKCLGISLRTIQTQIRALAKRGWIIRTSTTAEWGGRGPNEYRMGSSFEALVEEIVRRDKGGQP